MFITELNPAILAIIQRSRVLLENAASPLNNAQVDAVQEIYHATMRLLRSSPSNDDHGRAEIPNYELRTHLQIILGNADLLLAAVDGPLPPPQRQLVEQIRGNAKYLLTLTSERHAS